MAEKVYRPIRRLPPGAGIDYDYPVPLDGKMAKSYLWQIEQDARVLRKGLGDHDRLPGWVNSYIYTSADRLQTASRYMQYKFKTKTAKKNPQLKIPQLKTPSGPVNPLIIGAFAIGAALISGTLLPSSRIGAI